jgi:hypothetical protein
VKYRVVSQGSQLGDRPIRSSAGGSANPPTAELHEPVLPRPDGEGRERRRDARVTFAPSKRSFSRGAGTSFGALVSAGLSPPKRGACRLRDGAAYRYCRGKGDRDGHRDRTPHSDEIPSEDAFAAVDWAREPPSGRSERLQTVRGCSLSPTRWGPTCNSQRRIRQLAASLAPRHWSYGSSDSFCCYRRSRSSRTHLRHRTSRSART